MATYAENLLAAQNAYAEKLASIAGEENAKLNYTVGDRTFDWVGYQEFLLDAIDRIEVQMQAANGPFIVRAYGRA